MFDNISYTDFTNFVWGLTKTIVDKHLKRFFIVLKNQTSSPFEEEERTDLGLVKGHAYGITAVKRIDLNENKLFKMFK